MPGVAIGLDIRIFLRRPTPPEGGCDHGIFRGFLGFLGLVSVLGRPLRIGLCDFWNRLVIGGLELSKINLPDRLIHIYYGWVEEHHPRGRACERAPANPRGSEGGFFDLCQALKAQLLNPNALEISGHVL